MMISEDVDISSPPPQLNISLLVDSYEIFR